MPDNNKTAAPKKAAPKKASKKRAAWGSKKKALTASKTETHGGEYWREKYYLQLEENNRLLKRLNDM